MRNDKLLMTSFCQLYENLPPKKTIFVLLLSIYEKCCIFFKNEREFKNQEIQKVFKKYNAILFDNVLSLIRKLQKHMKYNK